MKKIFLFTFVKVYSIVLSIIFALILLLNTFIPNDDSTIVGEFLNRSFSEGVSDLNLVCFVISLIIIFLDSLWRRLIKHVEQKIKNDTLSNEN